MVRLASTVVSSALLLSGAGVVQAEGDAAAGKEIFGRCRTCHVIDEPSNRLGPHLVGIIGRKAGSIEGYNFSSAMQNAEITWNDETLKAFLSDPSGYIPGNAMQYPPLTDEQEIRDLLAYLHEAAGS
jgi:cytochrome c2